MVEFIFKRPEGTYKREGGESVGGNTPERCGRGGPACSARTTTKEEDDRDTPGITAGPLGGVQGVSPTRYAKNFVLSQALLYLINNAE